jgi:predicted nucleotidyltransferase
LLEDRLGRRVDVVTKEGIEPAIRDRVLREAEVVF